MEIYDLLINLKDEEYKNFHKKLIPDIDSSKIIGIRIPDLRHLYKEIKEREDFLIFLKELPHKYYEVNNLHALYINDIKDADLCIYELNRFLPYVDNWATCDLLRPKAFFKNKEKLLEFIKENIVKENTFTVRYALEMLMVHFLDSDFKEEYNDLVISVNKEDYYINMMQAWYFQVALLKQYDKTISYFTQNKIPLYVHNKAIRKSIESLRISKEKKQYLRTLKR